MIIQKPKVMVPLNQFNENILLKLERYARVCYKSENQISSLDNEKFIEKLINSGHESVIEHEKITVLFIVDRGISHEIVRHRIASYSQESTRYCNYSKGRFGAELTFIEPFSLIGTNAYGPWQEACLTSEKCYFDILKLNCSPQEARAVLPNSLKTEIVVTYNLREWRHFFKLRSSSTAHPQMRQVAIPLLKVFQDYLPIIFNDIKYDINFPFEHFAEVVMTDCVFGEL